MPLRGGVLSASWVCLKTTTPIFMTPVNPAQILTTMVEVTRNISFRDIPSALGSLENATTVTALTLQVQEGF